MAERLDLPLAVHLAKHPDLVNTETWEEKYPALVFKIYLIGQVQIN